jgi:hypothetical protein
MVGVMGQDAVSAVAFHPEFLAGTHRLLGNQW